MPPPAKVEDERVWKHFTRHHQNKGTNYCVTCNVCNKKFQSIGATKARVHLSGIKGKNISICTGPTFDDDGECTSEYSDAMFDKLRNEMKELHEGRVTVYQQNNKRKEFAFGHCSGTAPPEKRALSSSSNARPVTISDAFDASQSTAATAAVCRFFYAHKIAFNACNTLTFKEMVHEVSKTGEGYIFGGLRHLSNGGIESERARLVTANAKTRRDVIDEYGVTLCSDGKADVQSNPLINALIVHLKGVEHLDTFNATGATKKTGLFLRALAARRGVPLRDGV